MAPGLIEVDLSFGTASPMLWLDDIPPSANSSIAPPIIDLNQVRERVDALLQLKPGWNGYNAPALDRKTAAYEVGLFARLMSSHIPLPTIVPTVNGGIQMEWHTNHHHVELEVDRVGEFTLFVQNRDTGASELVENDVKASREKLSDVLS